ncbi:MAG: methyltransferase domain-containing protein [Nanoarchaeota archaeon]|nr:methyltransferase domain-containing protein [Nanoarchaeota archaeon]
MEKNNLQKEEEAFDRQVDERINHGFIPDLRRLRKVDWFYNNVWRDPEFVKIQLMPKVDFVLDIAKKRGGKVIELGCGHGYLTLELARNNLDVIGVDLSSKSIEIAEKFANENKFKDNFGSLTYKYDNILSMDLGKNIFDSIVFFGTLHHMPNVDTILSKANEALKKGGNLIVCEPVRDKFNIKSAEFAAIFRAILPTWEPYDKKLKGLDNRELWDKYVEQILNEYTYKDEHQQSPCDNLTSSEGTMVDTIKKYFEIKTIQYSDAIIDKLIGGLRGEDKYILAKFLRFLDEELIRKKILPPTSIRLHAIKK